MNPWVQISVTVSVVMAVSFFGMADDRRLSMESQKVDAEGTVWDFSQSGRADRCPMYRSYGDTLVAEIYSGCRQWYGLRNDSAFYMGEETRFYKAVPETPIQTSAFGNPLLLGREDGGTRGVYCRTFALGQDGSYESLYPIRGRLVLAEGNAVSADAVTERRSFTEWLVSDSLPDGLKRTRETVRTRWFVAGDTLPVALQITENVLHNGRKVSSVTSAFIVPASEIAMNEESLREAVQDALDNARISLSGSMVRIEGDFPADVNLTLHISDIAGSRFHHEPLGATLNSELWEIPLPALPPGQYILTVSAGTPSNRKITVSI